LTYDQDQQFTGQKVRLRKKKEEAMSTYKIVLFHILCDECSVCFWEEDPPQNVTQTEAHAMAREDGWKISKRIVCPDCQPTPANRRRDAARDQARKTYNAALRQIEEDYEQAEQEQWVGAEQWERGLNELKRNTNNQLP
jgi:hypothetical protein